MAWHCQAFGLNPVFISRVGSDELGENIKSAMLDWGMDVTGLQVDNDHPTGKVEVTINDGEPSYDIVPGSAWDFIDKEQLPKLEDNLLLYHGSLILRNNVSKDALMSLKAKINLPVFIDINLRDPWWELSTIRELMKSCDWLKLNENELAFIFPELQGINEAISTLRSENLLDMIIVTQGDKGAVVMTPGEGFLEVAPELNMNVVDTVGAGDAFSSIFLVGRYYQWPLSIILERAQEFASAIVGIRGATINDVSFYQPFFDKWRLLS